MADDQEQQKAATLLQSKQRGRSARKEVAQKKEDKKAMAGRASPPKTPSSPVRPSRKAEAPSSPPRPSGSPGSNKENAGKEGAIKQPTRASRFNKAKELLLEPLIAIRLMSGACGDGSRTAVGQLSAAGGAVGSGPWDYALDGPPPPTEPPIEATFDLILQAKKDLLRVDVTLADIVMCGPRFP